MKKALYGTTALVAAAVVAGQADAASGLKLGITGFYRGAVGVSFGDSNTGTFFSNPNPGIGSGMSGRNNVTFRQEVRVNFTGSTTLDNGITVDVLVGLNAGGHNAVGVTNAPARINRAYMDVSGKFGQIRFGDANSAYQSMCVGDPGNVTANFGLNSPNESFSNAGRRQIGGSPSTYMPTAVSGAGTCFGLETRSTKIIYFSPTFGGFNFAVSFAPDHIRSAGGSGGIGGSNGQGVPTGGTGAAFHDFLSAGLNFNHDFGGGITLTAGVSGEWALGGKTNNTDNASDLSNKPSMYQAGFQVGFGGGWAVGASGQYVVNYTNAGYGCVKSAFSCRSTSTDDAWMLTAGGSYTVDAISIGLEGLYNQYEAFDPNAAGGDSNGHATYVGVSLNAAYALGPGISLEGQVAWTQSDTNFDSPPTSFGFENGVNAYEIDFGTAINF